VFFLPREGSIVSEGAKAVPEEIEREREEEVSAPGIDPKSKQRWCVTFVFLFNSMVATVGLEIRVADCSVPLWASD